MDLISRYRFLTYFVSIALVAGYFEMTDPEADIEMQIVPKGYPEVISTMYPARSDSLFLKAMQAREANNLPEARRQLEAALGTGVKTDENLYYQYIRVLQMQKADPSEIDAAIAEWRRNYPFTQLPVPSTTVIRPANAEPDRDP